jgi:hypothetical protein
MLGDVWSIEVIVQASVVQDKKVSAGSIWLSWEPEGQGHQSVTLHI